MTEKGHNFHFFFGLNKTNLGIIQYHGGFFGFDTSYWKT